MLLFPAALVLSLLSLACLLTAPIALAVAAALVVWGAVADVEVAIVVSRRRRTGSKGQSTIVSARSTPRRAARAVGALARTLAESAAGAARRWTETEQAARAAAGAAALADVGPAALTVGAVCAAPWAMLAAPDGASAAAAAGAAVAIAHHMTRAAGLRYRAD